MSGRAGSPSNPVGRGRSCTSDRPPAARSSPIRNPYPSIQGRAAYQDPVTGQRMKPGTKLGDVYQEKALPVAKQRLYQAGSRLAMVLNEAWPEK